MKYIFFFAGAFIFLAGVQLAVNGALEGWDAAIAAAPLGIGAVLMIAAVGIHIYDNWEAKQ